MLYRPDFVHFGPVELDTTIPECMSLSVSPASGVAQYTENPQGFCYENQSSEKGRQLADAHTFTVSAVYGWPDDTDRPVTRQNYRQAQ
jgi:hypothetical protein